MDKNKIGLLVAFLFAFSLSSAGQGMSLTAFGGYTLQDKVYGYYGDLIIGEGAHFGGMLRKELSPTTAFDLTYSYQSTTFGLKDYSSYNPSNRNYSGSVSYLMIGSTHSPDFSAKVSPYGGAMLGAAIFSAKEIISETWKFAVGLKLGVVYHASEKVGVVIQTQLMVPVQGVGLYVGTGGAGAGTTSSATQLGFTGGLQFKIGN